MRIRLCAASDAQRLAHGRAADSEVAREHRLRRQPRAGLQLPADDPLTEPLGDLLVLLDGYAGTSAATPARYGITSSAVVTSA